MPSVALHVVELSFKCGFDSFRAHHVSLQAQNLRRTPGLFRAPMPGRLSDVFGLRTEEFYRPATPPEFSLNGKIPAQMSVLAPLARSLYGELRIERGPETPSGIYARVVEGRALYVNTPGEEKSVPIRGKKRGIVSGTSYENVVRLNPYDADLVE